MSDAKLKDGNDDLDEIIDFQKIVNETDKDDKFKIINEDEIYRQRKVDLWDLKDKIEKKVPIYKKKAPSARHGGFTSLRMSLLRLIFRASLIAKKMHKDFHGLTLYECQKAMELCNVSTHTVRDNLRMLEKMGRLKTRTMKLEGKSSPYKFYNIDMTSFPCQDGFYIIWGRSINRDALFFLSCPEYPHCSLKKRDCRILTHLKKLDEILTPLIRSMEGRESVIKTTKIRSSSDEKKVKVVTVHPFKDIPKARKKDIAKMLIRWRNQSPPLSIKDCVKQMKEEEGVIITNNLVYRIMEEFKKGKKIKTDAEESVEKEIPKEIPEEEKEEETPEEEIEEVKDFDELTDERKEEIMEKIRELQSKDFPPSYGETIDIILEEEKIKIVRYHIMKTMM